MRSFRFTREIEARSQTRGDRKTWKINHAQVHTPAMRVRIDASVARRQVLAAALFAGLQASALRPGLSPFKYFTL